MIKSWILNSQGFRGNSVHSIPISYIGNRHVTSGQIAVPFTKVIVLFYRNENIRLLK